LLGLRDDDGHRRPHHVAEGTRRARRRLRARRGTRVDLDARSLREALEERPGVARSEEAHGASVAAPASAPDDDGGRTPAVQPQGNRSPLRLDRTLDVALRRAEERDRIGPEHRALAVDEHELLEIEGDAKVGDDLPRVPAAPVATVHRDDRTPDELAA